ncbi:MAG: hypothetical protein Q9227_005141 [Pyrenula ochraceoflavens]
MRPASPFLPPSNFLYNLVPRCYPLRHLRTYRSRAHTTHGLYTPYSLSDPFSDPPKTPLSLPYTFSTAYALYAKRPSRAFPPPFVSPPSGSFSDPLTTHTSSRDRRRPHVNGQLIRGITNGDDAVVVNKNFLSVMDGVGAWSQKEKGHAALWSRLVGHFWDVKVEEELLAGVAPVKLDPVGYLQEAVERTREASLQASGGALGTTTAVGVFLHWEEEGNVPVVHVTNLGDCCALVVRKGEGVVYRSTEKWHWFDCPYQVGTNSKDEPEADAVYDKIKLQEGDCVVVVSDGVTDNLWEQEIGEKVLAAMESSSVEDADKDDTPMLRVAKAVRDAARQIAEDPFTESPYMERAVDEGLSIEGGMTISFPSTI